MLNIDQVNYHSYWFLQSQNALIYKARYTLFICFSSNSQEGHLLTRVTSRIHEEGYLLTCISRAFNVDYEDCKSLMNDSEYVLTPDYAMKMMNINECRECKFPVIICGETGVGKTFLIEMVSKLWNLSRNLKTRRILLMVDLYCSNSKFKITRYML